MIITVKNLYKRISPRKIRPSLFGLRNMNIQAACDITKFGNKKADRLIHDLIKAGIAACKEQYLDIDSAIIKSIACNEGPRLKRAIPWSKGQSRRIVHRLSHIVLNVEAQDKTVKKSADVEKK